MRRIALMGVLAGIAASCSIAAPLIAANAASTVNHPCANRYNVTEAAQSAYTAFHHGQRVPSFTGASAATRQRWMNATVVAVRTACG